MTTPPSFPALAGLGWSTHKKPTFATVVARHASGREVRNPLYQNPIWQFELTFDGMTSSASGPFIALGAGSLQSLMGLFLQCQGQCGTFLYMDPTDSAATGRTIATGDGATMSFLFTRPLGGFVEPVGWVTSVSAVYLNGVSQGSGWSLSTPNSLVFTSAPGSGVIVSADFAWAFECRFDDDEVDFEQFMANVWTLKGLKFRSVRTC
jgi:hypothetical protein